MRLFSGLEKEQVVNLRGQILGQPGRQTFLLSALCFNYLAVASFLFRQVVTLAPQLLFLCSVDELTLRAVEVTETIIVRMGRHL